MQLGAWELTTVSGGQYWIDGGTMFGVVPKALWSRVFPCDEHNNILQETNCVLARDGERTVLIDTGYGSKLSDKQRRIFRSEEGDPLLRNLQQHGVQPEDVDAVLLSHLHFDHAGGATRYNEANELVPTFPNAEYVAGRLEWVTATAGFPELKGVYPQENLLPLQESGQLRLVDGNAELVPGMHACLTGGHTHGHAAIVISGDDSADESTTSGTFPAAVYLGDLCPTTRHLPVFWGMGYDVDMLQLRRMKSEVLGRIADDGWLALFDHDPDHAAGTLRRDDRRDFQLNESMEAL